MGRLFFFAAALGVSAAASSIVWRGDVPVARVAGSEAFGSSNSLPVGFLRYEGGRTDRGSAVLIGEDVILTAGHMQAYGARAFFVIEGQEVPVAEWVVHPRFRRAAAAFDYAVARLERRVTHVAPAPLFNGPVRRSQPVWIAGAGGAGPIGGPMSWNWQVHAGTNRVGSVSSTSIRTTFDRPGRNATEIEAHLVPGDSGGGIFLEQNGKLALAGVAISRSGAGYGASSTFFRVSNVESWIRASGWSNGAMEFDLTAANFVGEFSGRAMRVEWVQPGTTEPIQSWEGTVGEAESVLIRSTLRGVYEARVQVDGFAIAVVPALTIAATPSNAMLLNLRAGDATGDGTINGADLFEVQMRLGATQGSALWRSEADANGDAVIDWRDLELVQANQQ